jgi:hypothetical protein
MSLISANKLEGVYLKQVAVGQRYRLYESMGVEKISCNLNSYTSVENKMSLISLGSSLTVSTSFFY